MRVFRLFLFILTIVWGCQALAPPSYGAAYHGMVVDAETKAPLEGAVVVVVWYKKPLVTMDGPQYFHKAVEGLTDAEGKFSVDASPGIDWNPLTRILKDPWIVIFKPGYGPFPEAHVSPRFVMRFGEKRQLGWSERNEELLKGAVVELPRLKTRGELENFTDTPGISYCLPKERMPHCVPLERIPNLMRLVNIQRKNLGLQPLPEPFEKERKP